MKELLGIILAIIVLIWALREIRFQRKWFAEDETMMKGWIYNRDIQLAAQKSDLDKMTQIAAHNVSVSLRRMKDVKKLKRQLANRKGQITKLKNERERRSAEIMLSSTWADSKTGHFSFEFMAKDCPKQILTFDSDLSDEALAIKSFEEITGLTVENIDL